MYAQVFQKQNISIRVLINSCKPFYEEITNN